MPASCSRSGHASGPPRTFTPTSPTTASTCIIRLIMTITNMIKDLVRDWSHPSSLVSYSYCLSAFCESKNALKFSIGSIGPTPITREQTKLRCSKWFQSIARPPKQGVPVHQIQFWKSGSGGIGELLQKWPFFEKFIFCLGPCSACD